MVHEIWWRNVRLSIYNLKGEEGRGNESQSQRSHAVFCRYNL